MSRVFVLFSLCLANFVLYQRRTEALEEGDVCLKPPGSIKPWVCQIFHNCPAAVRLIKERKPPPADRRCGYKGTKSVVCCPPYNISDWSTDEPLQPVALNAPIHVISKVNTTSINVTTTTKNTITTTTATPGEDPSATPIILPPATDATLALRVRKPPEDHWEMVKVASKAAAKCEEYRQLYLSTTTEKPKPRTFVHQPVGGEDPKPKEFLHMALLGYDLPPSYLCGGSLISERFVLSAAHCERHPTLGAVRTVLLGDLDLASVTEDVAPRTYFVVGTYVHSAYKEDSLYHDIMLIELNENVKFNHFIKPICLQPTKEIHDDSAIVTGWSLIDTDGPSSHILQKVEVPFVNEDQCNGVFRNASTQRLKFGIVDDIQLCAGAEEGKDSCQGDSGGPLQIPLEGGEFMQVGIVSYGKNRCGPAKIPGVYTRVSAYVPWIESIVWPEPSSNNKIPNAKVTAAPGTMTVSPDGSRPINATTVKPLFLPSQYTVNPPTTMVEEKLTQMQPVQNQIPSWEIKGADTCMKVSSNNSLWRCKPLKDCPTALRLYEQSVIPEKFFCGDCIDFLCVCCPPYDITSWYNFKPPSKMISAILSSRVDNSLPTNDNLYSKATVKCQEYAELYYAFNESYWDSVISGRKPPPPKDFIHMALLGYGDPLVYLCGGTLISERFVLTAAHCERSERFGPVRTVLLGDVDVTANSDGSSPRHYSILRKYVHTDYKQSSLYHDVMLLELIEDVKFSEYVIPVCLQTDKRIPETTGIVTGWARTKPLGPPSNILHEPYVELPFVSHKDCNKALRSHIGTDELEFGILDHIQICAVAEDGKDSCNGDSGGPLQVTLVEKMYMQVGIVSSGNIFCGTAGEPNVYTRVSAYIPWIESIVWPDIKNPNDRIQKPPRGDWWYEIRDHENETGVTGERMQTHSEVSTEAIRTVNKKVSSRSAKS